MRPVVGQLFARADERPNARVAVVSTRIWRKYLDGASDAAGRLLQINGVPYQVVAVLPDGFDDPLESGVDVWVPLNTQPGGPNSFDNYYLSAIGRLEARRDAWNRRRPSWQRSRRACRTIARRRRACWSANVVPLQTDTIGSAGPMLWILLGAVGLLLIIACVNVASLFLARGAARETELAVRAALGCSGWRLVRQLLVESVLLSLDGRCRRTAARQDRQRGAAGGSARSRRSRRQRSARTIGLGVQFRCRGSCRHRVRRRAGIQATRPDLEGMLRESGRSGSGSRRQTRARNVLVVCQMALALVLLIGAGLLLRSVRSAAIR